MVFSLDYSTFLKFHCIHHQVSPVLASFWVNPSGDPFSFFLLQFSPLDSCHSTQTVIQCVWVQAVASTACFLCWESRFLSGSFLFLLLRIGQPQNHHQIPVSFQFRLALSVLLIEKSLHFQHGHLFFHIRSFPTPAALLIKFSLTVILLYTFELQKSRGIFLFPPYHRKMGIKIPPTVKPVALNIFLNNLFLLQVLPPHLLAPPHRFICAFSVCTCSASMYGSLYCPMTPIASSHWFRLIALYVDTPNCRFSSEYTSL